MNDYKNLKDDISELIEINYLLKNEDNLEVVEELNFKKGKTIGKVKDFIILEIGDDIEEIMEIEINSIKALKNRIRKLREYNDDINYIKNCTDSKLIDFFEVY